MCPILLAVPSPVHFIKASPTEQSVTFAGEFLDLTSLSNETGLNYTYLSHIFSAHSSKLPSTKYGIRLARALGMDYPDFISELLSKKSAKTQE